MDTLHGLLGGKGIKVSDCIRRLYLHWDQVTATHSLNNEGFVWLKVLERLLQSRSGMVGGPGRGMLLGPWKPRGE